MRTALLFAAVCLAAPLARAEALNGSIDDPGLRRKTQLVYIESVPGKFTPPAEPAVMSQQGNKYVPALLPVIAGQKIEFQSQDPELHNVYARAGKTVIFNQAVLPKKMFERVINDPGVVHLSCNIHKEMSADIVVLQNPYYAKPDAKTGKFTIDNVPAGSYTLRIFGPDLSDEQKAKKFAVTVGGAPVKVM